MTPSKRQMSLLTLSDNGREGAKKSGATIATHLWCTPVTHTPTHTFKHSSKYTDTHTHRRPNIQMCNYCNIFTVPPGSLCLCFYTKPFLTISVVFPGRQDVTKDQYTSMIVKALAEMHKRANRENVVVMIFPVGAFFGQST